MIDEVGLSYSNRHADLLFNIVSSRSQRNATIVTTNRFAEWGEAFPNAACRRAGRPPHPQRRDHFRRRSWRRKETEERQKRRNDERRRRRRPGGGN